MSQNKTVIQGLKIEEHGADTGKINQFYRPTPEQVANENDGTASAPPVAPKTQIGLSPIDCPPQPAVAEKAPAPQPAAAPAPAPQPQKPQPAPKAPLNVATTVNDMLQNRPLVGMLVSASHGGKVELFPIYLGRNVIGHATKADVRLSEASVSESHAVIVVRRQQQPKSLLLVSIKDTNSSYGTYVNGQSIDYDVHLIEDHDVIQVGLAYRLTFIKLDVDELGLKACPDFQSTESRVKPAPAAASRPKPEGATPSVLEGVVPQAGGHAAADNTFNPYRPDREDDEPRTVLYR